MNDDTNARVRWYFARHGQTDWNAEGRIQGQTDIPLNATGRGQATANGERLRSLIEAPDTFDFVASPLGRTRETMERARSAMGLDAAAYRTDARLKELTFGDWEGFTLEEQWHADAAMVEARKRDKWNFVPPNGESYAMLSDRCLPVLEDLPERAVIVSHGGIMRAVIRHLTRDDEIAMATQTIPQDQVWLWNGTAGEWV